MWFFSSRQGFPRSPDCPRRSSFRPRLEALEDRRLLSAGALDATFGNGGVLTTALSRSTDDRAYHVAVQPDGKILAVGDVWGSTDQYGLVRYNANGSLDTGFGKGGIVLVGSNTSSHYAQDVALQPDGKIDVTDGNSWTVLQFNANGTLDTTFGSRGQVVIPFSGFAGPSYCRPVIQPPAAGSAEGKILVVGDINRNAGLVGLARLNPGGSLDTTFGSGGRVTTTIGPGSGYLAHLSSVALQSDGKIVVSGSAGPGSPTTSSPRAFVVARYNATGSLDGGFGSGGIVTTVVAGMPYENAMQALVQPGDGKIVAAGFAYDNTAGINDWGLVRYNPDGSLDTGFGSGGIVATAAGTARAAAIGSDGNIVVAGNNASSSFAVGRYLAQATTVNGAACAAGSPDPTFGTGGIATTSVGAAGSDAGEGVAIQPDGKIVEVGRAQVGSYNQFAVVRYLASAPQIGSFTASPDSVTAGSSTTLTASNITDGNAGSSITQVTFYYFDSSGHKVTLGTSTTSNGGAWTLSWTVSLPAGSYTLFAQAEDSYDVFGDPTSLTLQLL
jgi:uncharacterized delta-60 repeat protein